MTTTTTLPLGIALRPEGTTACAHCGTPATGPTIRFDVFSREVPVGSSQGTRVEEVVNGGTVDLGLCDTCSATGGHAARLLDANPRIARGIGSPARHQVTCALNALQVIGAALPEQTTDEALRELLELAPLGAAARWSARFSPTLRRGSREEHAASEPWLFVGTDIRTDIRRGYAHWLARRLPPRPAACPSGGCLLCGVGEVMARHGDKPWRETTVNASVLSGVGGSVTGHLCQPCQAAQDDAGSHMLDAAILAVVDPDRAIRRKRPYAPTVNGARGWAVTGRKPNRKPFGHLNLDGLRTSLLSGDW
ncbi:hypothetical protein CQ047_16580 [Microbacterium sp. MYb72]|uniref:hypothetical protein n=1 Tax=Microbacterium sp. MYb72 TaxID=1848693 RepID=UPI000CFC490F|nr:hypothetical protein [Microbacterium sp. MYb72]PRB04605.1 hypothetical protein CQ047_16580 [Microbacterium sp. MYb72]